MKRSGLRVFATLALLFGATAVARAETYFTLEQVSQKLLPEQVLQAQPLTLTRDQIQVIEQRSGLKVRQSQLHAWRADSGAWLLVDRVLGKHDYITYALAIGNDGRVVGLEIMEYLETYGGQVRMPNWRAQFLGKAAGAPLKVDTDIDNISGATLSSVHVTEGVRRLLATYAVALAPLNTP